MVMEFNRILDFVCDKATADAAARRLRLWRGTHAAEGKALHDRFLRLLVAGHLCFDSEALWAELRALQPADMETSEALRDRLLPGMQSILALLAELGGELEADTSRARKALNTFPARLDAAVGDMQQTLANVPDTRRGRDFAHTLLTIYPQPALFHLQRALARALARPGNRLRQAAQRLQHAISGHFGAPFSISRTPAELDTEARLADILCHWYGLAADIRDKASADAAADWLAQQEAALGCRMADLPAAHECSLLPVLAYGWRLATIHGHLDEAKYYG